jgi:hypothetical protein
LNCYIGNRPLAILRFLGVLEDQWIDHHEEMERKPVPVSAVQETNDFH